MLKNQKDEWQSRHNLFYYAVEKEREFEDPHVLYTIQVILYYAATKIYEPDAEWMWKLYRQALTCTEQKFDSQHPDIISLLQGSAQALENREMKAYWKQRNREHRWRLSKEEAEKHKLQSIVRWKGEVEALLSRALSGLQKLHGYTAHPTLDCSYEVVSFHRRHGDADTAESILREMCLRTEQELGEEHDETLSFKAELSSLLLEQNRSEDAGLHVHKYISEHWEVIQSTSTLDYALALLEKHAKNRGWKAMIVLNEELSRHQAAFHFVWADHNLYTLPVHNVKLSPVFPSETQKDSAWRFNPRASEVKSGSQTPIHGAEVNTLMFPSTVNSDLSIDLRVPYISYSHFMSTVSFQQGEQYLEYVKAAEDSHVSSLIYEDAEGSTPIKVRKFMELLKLDSVEKKGVMDADEYPKLNVHN